MIPPPGQPDHLDALLDLAAAHCMGYPERLKGLATALGMTRREASRCLYARRSRPNGAKALALYDYLATSLKREAWLPWRNLDRERWV